VHSFQVQQQIGGQVYIGVGGGGSDEKEQDKA
jgi:hypothetical protein